VLRTRAAAAADAEVRARLEAAARSISGLKVEAKALKSTISTGERLPVQFLMRNDGPDPILILPSLPGAGFQMDRKFPCFSAR
jgi:hypothetical protein